MVITRPTDDDAKPSEQVPGDNQMRTVSFMLAFAFVLAGPSMAGSVQSGLPGIGTFSYNGSLVVTPAPLVPTSCDRFP